MFVTVGEGVAVVVGDGVGAAVGVSVAVGGEVAVAAGDEVRVPVAVDDGSGDEVAVGATVDVLVGPAATGEGVGGRRSFESSSLSQLQRIRQSKSAAKLPILVCMIRL